MTLIALHVFAIVMVTLAMMGGWQGYSPIPYWDMIDGALGFYIKIMNGEYSEWWAQHNEHRILLARVLFFIDYRFFGGLSYFLIIINYILAAAIAYTFYCFIIEKRRFEYYSDTTLTIEKALILWITAWLFLWVQWDNFTWAFQSQVFLAQLLPLCALFWLARSTQEKRRRPFIVACLLGVLSIGTQANGVCILPLMAIYSLFTRQSIKKTSVLFILSFITLTLYFYHYTAPSQNEQLLNALQQNPFKLLLYILIYLGHPFFYLLGPTGIQISTMGALCAGVLLIVGAAWIVWRYRRLAQNHPVIVALLFFILYIGVTAFATAEGRLIFGINQALASRYSTPVLMAWAALFIAYYLSAEHFTPSKIKIVLFTMLIASVPMLLQQTQALKSREGELTLRKVAALALALNIKDDEAIHLIYPDSTVALKISQAAVAQALSVFGAFPYLDLQKQLGTVITKSPRPRACLGQVEKVELIDGVAHFIRVGGWIFDPTNERSPQLIRFVDDKKVTVGFALSGFPRGDIQERIDEHASESGFFGYLPFSANGKTLVAIGEPDQCQLKLSIPQKPSSQLRAVHTQ